MNKRIFCIGDSFTNLGRDDIKSWPDHLSDMLPSSCIINLGWPGVGKDVSITTLKHSISGVYIKNVTDPITPSAVVLQLSDHYRTLFVNHKFPRDYISNAIDYQSSNYVTWSFKKYKRPYAFYNNALHANPGTVLDKNYNFIYPEHTENLIHRLKYDYSWQKYNEVTFTERDVVYIRHLCKVNNIPLILYTHKNSISIDFTDFSIETILGDKFDDYVIDDGFHFNNEGSKFVAMLIKEKLENV